MIVAAHHPLMEVHRSDSSLGAVTQVVTSQPLQRLRDMLVHYPNVILYLCGHTHLPEVVEVQDATRAFAFAQMDVGSLLVFPQEAAIVELLLEDGSTEVGISAHKMGAMLAPGSDLASRVAESHAASFQDAQSRPRYSDWRDYSGRKSLPVFPVGVAKYEL
ncbi:MAG: hypothetical protein HY901_19325 [Deltaproteobacteria bacterium]|nr:hypothetical protein [Deltaproteobacteria bacterium]